MINFTEEALAQARTSRNRIRNLLFELRHIERDLPPVAAVAQAIDTARAGFAAGLEDDLNVSEALAALFELVRAVNTVVSRGELGQGDARRVIDFLADIDDKVLACLTQGAPTPTAADTLEAWVREKIETRQKARAGKDFRRADEIRRELLEAGIILEDTKDGVRWKKAGTAKP
jgi:cysteinyl-tRNA synthetase